MKPPLTLVLIALNTIGADFAVRFEEIKKSPSPTELYSFLYALPKGGDLHHHTVLSVWASVLYNAATSKETAARNTFYTLTKFGNCAGSDDARPRFHNIQRATYGALGQCEKAEYQPLASLSPELKTAWMSSLILDRPGE